ncbi:hypothetical protein [Arthrobacter sp. NPDC090010]|uniref:hypothetical protein n=1 Tax=Arthrobacter sp. NPDC090010 TaxID=3363942 RepID=UPI003818CA86
MGEIRSVEDATEIQALRNILSAFKLSAAMHESFVEGAEPAPGSQFEADDSVTSPLPMSYYIRAQIEGSFQALDALRLMMVTETNLEVQVLVGPVGPYTLLRQALDGLALGLWIIQPQNQKLRIRRLLLAEKEEAIKSRDCLKELGFPHGQQFAHRTQVISEIQAGAGIHGSLGRLESTTNILKALSMYTDPAGMSWLGAWQLCSGLAHNKRWALLAAHDKDHLLNTADGMGSEYEMTISYTMLSGFLAVTVAFMRCAIERYRELASAPNHFKPSSLSFGISPDLSC